MVTTIDQDVKMREEQEAFEAKTFVNGFTIAKLRETFNEITASMSNWKMPIRHTFHHSRMLCAIVAIEFYTGTPSEKMTFTHDGNGNVTVSAPGYYASVGA